MISLKWKPSSTAWVCNKMDNIRTTTGTVITARVINGIVIRVGRYGVFGPLPPLLLLYHLF